MRWRMESFGRDASDSSETENVSVLKTDVRPGGYYDSIVLMQLQAALADLPGVLDAGAVMATPENRALLAASELLPGEAVEAGPTDLLVVVKAESDVRGGRGAVSGRSLLVRSGGAGGRGLRPRSLESALKLSRRRGGRWSRCQAASPPACGPGRPSIADSTSSCTATTSLADEVALKQRGGGARVGW